MIDRWSQSLQPVYLRALARTLLEQGAQGDLMMLYFKYLGRDARRRYLMRVGMAPLPDGTELPKSW